MFSAFSQKLKRKKNAKQLIAQQSIEFSLVEMKGSYLQQVPREIKVVIFSILNCHDLLSVSRVCKEWNKLVNEYFLFRQFVLKLSPHGPLPEPRVCQTSIAFENTLIIHGGHFPSSPHFYINNVKNDLFEFNFSTKTWKQVVGEFPYRTEHSVVSYSSALYIFGGYGPHRYSNELFRYDPISKECKEVTTSGTPPTPRSAHSAVVHENKMYIYGGWEGHQSQNDFYIYNFDTAVWSKQEIIGDSLPALRSHNAVVHGDCMYVTGGFGEEKGHSEHLYKVDLKTFESSVVQIKGSSPCGRSRSRATIFQDKLLILGGWDRKSYFADMHEFSFKNSTWKKIDIQLEETLGQHSLGIHDGVLYSFGGFLGKTQTPCNHLFASKLK